MREQQNTETPSHVGLRGQKSVSAVTSLSLCPPRCGTLSYTWYT